MKIYLVGGAVRDQIMGLESHDRDYVVVGSSIEEMQNKGYILVGKSFPVFIKHSSPDEYALARKEKKTGNRHTDFELVFDSSITLEEDLARRDFTCNAIAYDEETNRYIDCANGLQDIQNKILRHINLHFVEDPLRVIRLCRFVAQLDFDVAPETMDLCRKMCASDQLKYLSPERIWNEMQRALQSPRFHRFIETAHECGALKFILPQIEERYNEISNDLLNCIKNVETENSVVKFAFLLKDLVHSADDIKQICKALKVQNYYRRFAVFVYTNAHLLENIANLDLRNLLQLIESNKNPEQFENFIAACRGCSSLDAAEFTKIEQKLIHVYSILPKIKAEDMPEFEFIPKDASFKDKYLEFKLLTLKQALEFPHNTNC